MVFLTDRAADRLEEMLDANHAGPAEGVRVVPIAPGRIGLIVDVPHEGDEVIERDEQPLLIVDSTLVEVLQAAEIDSTTVVVAGEPYTEFTVRPAA